MKFKVTSSILNEKTRKLWGRVHTFPNCKQKIKAFLIHLNLNFDLKSPHTTILGSNETISLSLKTEVNVYPGISRVCQMAVSLVITDVSLN